MSAFGFMQYFSDDRSRSRDPREEDVHPAADEERRDQAGVPVANDEADAELDDLFALTEDTGSSDSQVIGESAVSNQTSGSTERAERELPGPSRRKIPAESVMNEPVAQDEPLYVPSSGIRLSTGNDQQNEPDTRFDRSRANNAQPDSDKTLTQMNDADRVQQNDAAASTRGNTRRLNWLRDFMDEPDGGAREQPAQADPPASRQEREVEPAPPEPHRPEPDEQASREEEPERPAFRRHEIYRGPSAGEPEPQHDEIRIEPAAEEDPFGIVRDELVDAENSLSAPAEKEEESSVISQLYGRIEQRSERTDRVKRADREHRDRVVEHEARKEIPAEQIHFAPHESPDIPLPPEVAADAESTPPAVAPDPEDAAHDDLPNRPGERAEEDDTTGPVETGTRAYLDDAADPVDDDLQAPGREVPPVEQRDDFLTPPVTDFQMEETVRLENRIDTISEELQSGDGHLEQLDEESKDGHSLDLGGNAPIADLSNWMRSADRLRAAAALAEEGEGEDEEFDVHDLIARDRVVAFLLRSRIVTAAQVRHAQESKRENDSSEALWRLLAEQEGVERQDVYTAAARVYAFPIADLEAYQPNVDFTRQIMEAVSEENRERLIDLRVVPYRAVRERKKEMLKLQFITHDPARPAVNKLMRELGIDSFELQYAPEQTVAEIIAEAFPKKNEYLERLEGNDAVDLGANYDEDSTLINEEELEAEISRSKLINLFEATLVEAVRFGASDIHIYPNAQKKVEVHFRVDGRLKHWHTEDKVHPEALLAVIKDNAMNVDRFERDKAQDGFIQRWVDDALIRYRVSVMPIANASQEIRSESIVIRVLDDRKVITDLSKLGLLEGALEKFAHAIKQPHGMVILTGPTGSGKSTTLVASLSSVVSPEVNVLTIEDPVEYIIPDVRQIKLSHKLGLSDALRSILRHDPDVVMVGEMRDRATAELAIKLANTGHLTFSTLHTNDAPSAISRLYKMDIEPFLIAYAINLVVAQRLIRTLCPDCKKVDNDPDPVMLKKLGFTEETIAETTLYTEGDDQSCPTCKGFNYKGRRAVAEALYFSRAIRHMIVEADRMIDEDAIRDQAKAEGMLTLQDSAREVVKMGETSVREMIRVVTSEAH